MTISYVLTLCESQDIAIPQTVVKGKEVGLGISLPNLTIMPHAIYCINYRGTSYQLPSIGAYQNLTSPKSDKHLAPGLWPARSGKRIGATSCPIVDR